MGLINETALQDLHLIVNLVKYLGELKDKEFEAPTFHWLLRDFYHDISEYKSPQNYMEFCLH